MGECINCGSECGEESAYCPFCDELHDVIESGDRAMSNADRRQFLSEEDETRVAMADLAYERLTERRGAYSEIPIGEGCTWKKGFAA